MPQPVIVIHAGAGTLLSEALPQHSAAMHRGSCEALAAGWNVLDAHGPALDAVERAVCVPEDCPLFNARRGAILNCAGETALAPCITDGGTMRAGAVTCVTSTRNPASLVRIVMHHAPHVLLAGDGADALAREHVLEQVTPGYCPTDARHEGLAGLPAAPRKSTGRPARSLSTGRALLPLRPPPAA